MLRPWALAVAVVISQGGVASSAGAQSRALLNGKVVDSTGAGVKAGIVVRSATQVGADIANDSSDATGSFHISLATLPARVVVEAIVAGGIAGRTELDSAAVRSSSERSVVIRVQPPHPLAPVKVQARYQKRPSIYRFLEAEPSSRIETVSPITTDWFDPLSGGDAAAILRASPDMLIGADGSASLMGAPASANQLQVNGVQVPAGLLTGMNGVGITASPWDITVGGAAGATVNLAMGTPRANHSTYVALRSGVGGVPRWAGAPGQARGADFPVQISAGSSGPVGKFGYGGTAFLQSDNLNLPRWDRTLGVQARGVLDSISGVLRAPTINASARSTQGGVIGRFDFVPYDSKRVLALTSAVTRSEHSGGVPGAFLTGSHGTDAVQDAASLQLESVRVLRERVLWTSQVGVSASTSEAKRYAVAPTIIATDIEGGNTVVTGAAPQQPASRVLAGEARATGAWYSRDNETHYVAQLQVRGERARLDGTDPHTTFMAASLAALQSGQAISLEREEGTGAASASSFVLAPAFGARHDIGKSGSVTAGVRADAWTTSGIATSGSMRYVDVSPRLSLYQRLGERSANRGSVATLRIGVGRFTSWPNVQQWADAWTGAGATRELCTGSGVPPISLTVEAPSCASGGVIQTLGRTVATSDLKPAASNRADVSLTFAEIAPGVTVQFGAGLAQNNRIAVRLSPLMSASVVGTLAGDGGRTLLVPESGVGADGIASVAPVPAGVPDVTRLLSGESSSSAQWRLKLASSSSFARVTWDARYVLTTGHERSLAIASATSAPSLVSGPLAAGGKHAFAFSLGTWIGEANIRIAGLARSGLRFTPLADRDLNGDGLANDAVFVPQSLSDTWASSVSRSVRSCIRASAGRIARLNSCTGPWNITSQIAAMVPGRVLGLQRGAEISALLSNPLAVFARTGDVHFGSVAAVNPTLLHITGFDPATHSYNGTPLSGFGTPLGLSSGIADPMRVTISIRIPLGPSITSQRMDKMLTSLQHDTSTRARVGASMEYLGDIPPVPLGILQSADAIQLTAGQRQKLQTLGSRWQEAASRLVLGAYGSGPQADPGGEAAVRQRLLRARAEFFVETLEINADIRNLLSPDQVELLPSGFALMLNPRFWKYVSLQDSSDF